MYKSSPHPQPLLWLAFIFLFLLTGTVGHDPWRQDETYSFGIIYHFYTTHSWLIPTNAGTPFMEKPPLYYWTAVLFMHLFSWALPLHDAARLASVFYMALSCASVWAASHVLFASHARRPEIAWIALMLFLGSLGLLKLAHDMFTDVALLAGTSIAFLGLSLLICEQQRWMRAGMVLGLGAGMAFLSKGLFVPAMLDISFIALFLTLPGLRSMRTIGALFFALVAAAPFLFIWPWLLYVHSPALFHEWFWANNVGRFLGTSVDRLGAPNKPLYMLYTVLWFAFPALPLACMRLLSVLNSSPRRGEVRRGAAVAPTHPNSPHPNPPPMGEGIRWLAPEIILPLTIIMVGLLLLTFSASARALYLMPLLPAFTQLAAPALLDVPPGLLVRWNRMVRLTAGAGAVIIVLMWVCLLQPHGLQPLKFLYRDWLRPGFLPDGIQWVAGISAVVLSLLWRATRGLDARSPVGTACQWFAAMALLWGLMNTVLLPWIDETRSFRSVFADLNGFVSQPAYADKCIARHSLGESVDPMWEYFGHGRGMGPQEDFNGKSCQLLLLMTGKKMAPVSDPCWHKVWSGSRPLDDKDELELFERNK